MKRIFSITSLSALLIIGVSCQSDTSRDQTSAEDRLEEKAENTQEIAEDANADKFDDRKVKNDADFVAEQVAANYAEVKMAKLAAEKSSAPEIKDVAMLLENEHSKKLQQLQRIADAKSITIPIEADKEAIKTVEDLRNEADPKNFNEEWCSEMVDHHEKTIETYEDKLESTEDPEIKSWISQSLPGLRSHLDQLKSIRDKLKDA